jgi:hypothetical protein
MPPQRTAPTQRKISFSPLAQFTRDTPRQNRFVIQNYSQLERIDELIVNPPQTPRTPHAFTRPARPLNDDDIGIDDVEGKGEVKVEEEEVPIELSDTLTR